jgi:predicted nucleic acid-binding protein
MVRPRAVVGRSGPPPGRRRRFVCSRPPAAPIRQHHLEEVRLGEFARDDGDAALAALRNGPVGLVATAPLVERALHLAHEIEHPLYDCVYLAAAEAVTATVATADRRFFERCSQSTVRSRIAWIADWPSAS